MTGFRLFETDHGVAAILWNAQGVSGFRLPADQAEETRRAVQRQDSKAIAAEPPPAMTALIDAARRYFSGERIDFRHVPIDLGRQEPFFARVYDHVRRLGWGETTTYGAVAQALGQGAEAARAVGQAMARNPVPLIIPCHRVLAAGGRIGGFSAPGGSNAKARMLALEGAHSGAADPAQNSFGF
jgi:methylated-DNA-[protein]-cysteine S-methyltransferase